MSCVNGTFSPAIGSGLELIGAIFSVVVAFIFDFLPKKNLGNKFGASVKDNGLLY